MAACVTGLERSFPEIGRNVLGSVLQVGRSVEFFGVRPANDSWEAMRRAVHFQTTVLQRPCTSVSRPVGYYPRWSVAPFVQSLCDLQSCDTIIHEHEVARNSSFASVMRLRLDIYWEMPVRLPLIFDPDTVHVPSMSRCHGFCDKFAVGGRAGMAAYLQRVQYIDRNFTRRYDSEGYLRMAASLSKFKVKEHADWMFCKFGDSQRAWKECTRRIRARLVCASLRCPWCGMGCRCWNATCTNSSRAASLCHVLAPNESRGLKVGDRDRIIPPGYESRNESSFSDWLPAVPLGRASYILKTR